MDISDADTWIYVFDGCVAFVVSGLMNDDCLRLYDGSTYGFVFRRVSR